MLKSKKLWWLVVCFILLASERGKTQTSYFDCALPQDSSQMPQSAVCTPVPKKDTLKAVVIYACRRLSGIDSTLPSWWSRVWNINNQLSVPKYYKDNSMGKYLMTATPHGRHSGDTVFCFVSDSVHRAPSWWGGLPLGGGRAYVLDILKQADDSINFADFDNDGPNGIPASQDTSNGGQGDDDGIVDAIFVVTVNHNRTSGTTLSGDIEKDTVHTQDFSAGGRRIVICGFHGTAQMAASEELAISICAHEYGHVLGLGDEARLLKSWGAGSFSLMGTAFWNGRAVPLDPINRTRFGWDTVITVNTPLFGFSIPDYLTSGVVYKLPAFDYPNNLLPDQYFYVTNHRGVDPDADARGEWERHFPDNGLLIWHAETPNLPCFNYACKRFDLELAHGMYRFDTTTCSFTTLSDSSSTLGFDSLDFKCGGYNPDSGLGSATCFWPLGSKKNFDEKSNPSSDIWWADTLQDPWLIQQNWASRVGVRNISATLFQSATADLLVNNWYGHITANTTLGPDNAFAITGDITVDAGKTLTIDSNTVVYLQAGEDNQRAGVDTTKIEINVASGGKLIINGTPSHPVKFLSSKAEAQAGKDDWQGIKVDVGGNVSISNAIIRHAVSGIEDYSEYNHSIQNVRIGKCKSYGIRAQGTDSLTIRGCRVDSVNNYPSAGGTGIYANSDAFIGPKLVKDTAIACYYGFSIGHNTAPIETCLVLGDSTGNLVSNRGIFNQLQGEYGDTTYTLSISNTEVGGYFSLAHISNGSTGRLNISTSQLYTNEGTPRSPVGIQNDGGDYIKVRNSSILHWGTYGVLTDHSGGVPNLGVYSGDNGYNDLYTGVGGSSWKFVYDEDCGSCSTPVIKAEQNQWYTVPPSTRFSPNVDRTPYITPIQWEKLVADEGQRKENLPRHTELFQNYPNPFNPTTLIQFNLEKPEEVNLEIFNILGQKVRTMVPGEEFAAGPYTFLWDGKDEKGRVLSSGMYFYRLLTPSYSKTHKMMLVK